MSLTVRFWMFGEWAGLHNICSHRSSSHCQNVSSTPCSGSRGTVFAVLLLSLPQRSTCKDTKRVDWGKTWATAEDEEGAEVRTMWTYEKRERGEDKTDAGGEGDFFKMYLFSSRSQNVSRWVSQLGPGLSAACRSLSPPPPSRQLQVYNSCRLMFDQW